MGLGTSDPALQSKLAEGLRCCLESSGSVGFGWDEPDGGSERFGSCVRARGNAGEYRSSAVFVWWEGNLHSLLFRRSNKQGWGCWAGVRVLEHLVPESAENLYSPACPSAMQGNTEHVEGMVRFTGRFLAVRCNGSVRFLAVRFLRFGSVPEPSCKSV